MNTNRHSTLNACVIGLGSQSMNDHVPSLLRRDYVSLVAVCDINEQRINEFCIKYPQLRNKVKAYTSCSELLKNEKIDIAIVAVPHNKYLPIMKELCKRGVYFMKEKPLARNGTEMKKMLRLPNIRKYCFVCAQRRYSSLYKRAYDLKEKIGVPYLFSVIYTLKVANPNEGWRGNLTKAGGGCIIDMGYHIIDQLLWWFGEPKKIFVSKSSLAVPGVKGYAEDTSIISFKYNNGLQGSILLSRSAGEKREECSYSQSKNVNLLI